MNSNFRSWEFQIFRSMFGGTKPYSNWGFLKVVGKVLKIRMCAK